MSTLGLPTARPQRILFLDIDGVLNSLNWAIQNKARGLWGLDRAPVALLQKIVEKTNCQIVLSSSWRQLYSLAEVRLQLMDAGMKAPVPLIDKTPVLKRSELGHPMRGHEVEFWIKKNRFTGNYVCIDDDDDFLPTQPLVRTDVRFGLTPTEALACIEALMATRPV